MTATKTCRLRLATLSPSPVPACLYLYQARIACIRTTFATRTMGQGGKAAKCHQGAKALRGCQDDRCTCVLLAWCMNTVLTNMCGCHSARLRA